HPPTGTPGEAQGSHLAASGRESPKRKTYLRNAPVFSESWISNSNGRSTLHPVRSSRASQRDSSHKSIYSRGLRNNSSLNGACGLIRRVLADGPAATAWPWSGALLLLTMALGALEARKE